MGCPLSKTEGTPVEKNHQRPGQLSPRLAEQTRTPWKNWLLACCPCSLWVGLPSLFTFIDPKGLDDCGVLLSTSVSKMFPDLTGWPDLSPILSHSPKFGNCLH